jgi:type I restriction enzyme S subunit
LRPGDIVFNNTNSEELVGKTAYWNRQGHFALSNHMTIIRVLDLEALNSFFLANFLHKKWYDGLYQRLCHRYVNQASVSLARLKSIPIPLAPLPEQQQIASTLSAAARKVVAEERRKVALEALFKTMLHQLMTGQVRVAEDKQCHHVQPQPLPLCGQRRAGVTAAAGGGAGATGPGRGGAG